MLHARATGTTPDASHDARPSASTACWAARSETTASPLVLVLVPPAMRRPSDSASQTPPDRRRAEKPGATTLDTPSPQSARPSPWYLHGRATPRIRTQLATAPTRQNHPLTPQQHRPHQSKQALSAQTSADRTSPPLSIFESHNHAGPTRNRLGLEHDLKIENATTSPSHPLLAVRPTYRC